MKIKTITCHDVYNYGASLQAYALMTYLTNLGHDVEIIDYKPDYLSNHYRLDLVANPRYNNNVVIKLLYLSAKLPGRLKAKYGKRKKLFDEFKKEYLRVTDRRYSSNEELRKNLPEADIYIAGSDQIWNTNFQNGKDPAFFLEFVPDDKTKASYAASFAISELPDSEKQRIKKALKRMNYISVREKSGLKILKDLDINDGVNVLDPVFLLSKDEWDEIVPSINYKEKYILVYDFDSSSEIKEIVVSMAQKNHYKIYSFFKNDYADKFFEDTGPIEFVSLIKEAQYIVSNSFHGTAFSLIYNKDFFVVNRKENINTRMRDLLLKLKLDDRLVNNKSDIDGVIIINYYQVSTELNQLINESKKYLDKILDNAGRSEIGE